MLAFVLSSSWNPKIPTNSIKRRLYDKVHVLHLVYPERKQCRIPQLSPNHFGRHIVWIYSRPTVTSFKLGEKKKSKDAKQDSAQGICLNLYVQNYYGNICCLVQNSFPCELGPISYLFIWICSRAAKKIEPGHFCCADSYKFGRKWVFRDLWTRRGSVGGERNAADHALLIMKKQRIANQIDRNSIFSWWKQTSTVHWITMES